MGQCLEGDVKSNEGFFFFKMKGIPTYMHAIRK